VRTDVARKQGVGGDVTYVRETLWAVEWPHVLLDGQPQLSTEQVAAAFESHGRDASDARVRAKREHTLEFWSSTMADVPWAKYGPQPPGGG
jgi:hypothetical protein